MKYYVVWDWKKKWVFDNWGDCKKSVEWYSWAKYKSFKTLKEAMRAYWEKPTKHIWKKKFMWKYDQLFLLPSELWNIYDIISKSIVVDWACQNSTTGNMEFQGINMSTGEYIFQSKVYTGGTNNIAEFLALYEAIIWAKNNDFEWVIFSDSKIAISWIKKKVCNTDYQLLKNQELLEYIKKALEYLKNNEIYDKIYRWDTRNWGENPADYGRK